MLNLAATRARFHYCITHTHKHACTHTVRTHTDYVLIIIFCVRVRKLIITCLFPQSNCAGLVMATKQIFFSSESSQIQTSASLILLTMCQFLLFLPAEWTAQTCFFTFQRLGRSTNIKKCEKHQDILTPISNHFDLESYSSEIFWTRMSDQVFWLRRINHTPKICYRDVIISLFIM